MVGLYSNVEKLLHTLLTGEDHNVVPSSRVEILLQQIIDNGVGGGMTDEEFKEIKDLLMKSDMVYRVYCDGVSIKDEQGTSVYYSELREMAESNKLIFCITNGVLQASLALEDYSITFSGLKLAEGFDLLLRTKVSSNDSITITETRVPVIVFDEHNDFELNVATVDDIQALQEGMNELKARVAKLEEGA